MRTIIKFANGAEEVVEVNGNIFPKVFSMNTPEGVRFHFCFMDVLPSGTMLFKEISAEEAGRIWRDE